MYRNKAITNLLFCLLILVSSSVKADPKIRVGVYNNPPLCSIDSFDNAQGIFIDFLKEVAIEYGWDIEYVPVTLSEGMDALQYGKLDLLAAIAKNQQREQLFHFTSESVFTNWGTVYVGRKLQIENITDLANKRIALEQGDIHGKAMLQLLEDFNVETQVVWCNGADHVFSTIQDGGVDAGVVNKVFGIQNNKNQALKTTSIIFNPVNVHFAGGPLAQPLLSSIDSTLIKMRRERSEMFEAIVNQWLISGSKQLPGWVYYLIYSLLGLLFMMFFALLLQRRMVRSRTHKLREEQKVRVQNEKTILQIESEKSLILNSLDEQVVFMDRDYNLVWANTAFKKASSKPFEQIVGKKCHQVYFNKDAPCKFCNFERSQETNRTEVREHTDSLGRVFTHKTHPVFDSEQRPLGFVEIFSDISDKKKYEEELISAKEKAEQSDYLKSAFLANMSHEIRTPMNAIIGFSELLEDNTLNDDEKNVYLRIIQSNGQQLLKLISDILIFSQIEAGQIDLQYSKINITDLLKETYEQFNGELQKLNINVNFYLLIDKISDSEEFETDAVRIRQIISNLMTNAIKFTEKGRIDLGAKIENDNLIIFVKDTGIGIAKDKHTEVFKRFAQVENNQVRKARGTGLGLTIANDLIKQLGGEILLESEPEKGSTFYLIHPLKREKRKANIKETLSAIAEAK